MPEPRGHRTAYAEMPALLAKCRPISGNTVFASGSPDGTGYIVTSYGTTVATVTRPPTAHGRLVRWIDPVRHSATTSRVAGLCRANLPGLTFASPVE